MWELFEGRVNFLQLKRVLACGVNSRAGRNMVCFMHFCLDTSAASFTNHTEVEFQGSQVHVGVEIFECVQSKCMVSGQSN